MHDTPFDVEQFDTDFQRLCDALRRKESVEGDYERVVAYLRDLVTAIPCSSHLYCLVGRTERLAGLRGCRFEMDPRERYERAIELDPLNGEAYEGIGDLDILDAPESAVRYFRLALSASETVRGFLGLASALDELNEFEKAKEAIENARAMVEMFSEDTEDLAKLIEGHEAEVRFIEDNAGSEE